MWAASTTYSVGTRLLGVRTDTYELDTRLRAALESHVADGMPANNNYSVRLDDPAEGPATPLRRLYRGHSLEVASRSPGRVIDALLANLSGWALEEDADLVRCEAVAVVGGGRAVLLPASLSCHSPVLERRLARAGYGIVDAPVAHLDARTGELVVSAPRLDIDWTPLAPLRDDGRRPASEGTAVAPGRYPLACWAFARARHDDGPLSEAEAVVRAAGLSRGPTGMPAQRLLDLLGDTLAPSRAIIVDGDPAAVADAVIACLGR